MWLRRICYYTRPFVPMVIGLCLGIGLSLVLAPFLDDNCDVYSSGTDPSLRSSKHSPERTDFDYFNSDDFEPRIKRQVKPKTTESSQSQQTRARKVLRPRYASTELGIREKLLVAVLTSKDTIDTYGAALNKTLAQHVPKLIYFMDVRGAKLPGGMSIVSFTDHRPDLKPFHMIKYIGDHYRQAYDWFLIVPDTTYIRGEKVLDFVSDISISRTLHMGIPSTKKDASYCSVDGGVLLSQEVLSSVYDNNKWCSQNAFSPDIEDNIGRCIYQTSGLACRNTVNGKVYQHFALSEDGPLAMDSLQSSDAFNAALTVGPVHSEIDFYRLHRYFCELELRHTQRELERTKASIVNTSALTPGGVESATWPIGVQERYRPQNRFDVIRWDYFTEDSVYLRNDFSNKDTLEGVDKQDVDDIVKVAVEKLNEKAPARIRYTFSRLINGYRRFDPTRGMEYQLDLSFTATDKDDVIERVHLVRPLSRVEIVPMPYVTENARVHLVLAVRSADRGGVVQFLDSYAHTCLESGDNTNLLIVFVHDADNEGSNPDEFSVLESMIAYYETKYQGGGGAKMSQTSLTSGGAAARSQLGLLESITDKFPADSLILLCTVGMELSIDFLNRVRMNTIRDWQVFFPMAFYQYKPDLVYGERPYPTNIEIKKMVGHYDRDAYDHAAFYNSDYVRARGRKDSGVASLYEMFVRDQSLHVLRAVEPSLKHRYVDPPSCDRRTLSGDMYRQCLTRRSHGLASQSQLAMLIFEQQQNVDKLHLEVLHRQKDPDIDRMKVRK